MIEAYMSIYDFSTLSGIAFCGLLTVAILDVQMSAFLLLGGVESYDRSKAGLKAAKPRS